jgi:hypothetical protein
MSRAALGKWRDLQRWAAKSTGRHAISKEIHGEIGFPMELASVSTEETQPKRASVFVIRRSGV